MKIVYSDGSCLGNPGPGGWGVYLKHDNQEIKLYGHGGITTNNQMELKAAIMACQFVAENESAIVYTDSTYVIKGISEWIIGWKKNGWRTSDKKPVKNKELWIELDALNQKRKIQWTWVKAHNGDLGNEMVDKLAKKGASSQTNEHLLSQYRDLVLGMASSEIVKENKAQEIIEFNVLDSVDVAGNAYIILKEVLNEKGVKGFLLSNIKDTIYINDLKLMKMIPLSEELKFKILEKAQKIFSNIYHEAKNNCKHKLTPYEEDEYAVCIHCQEGFGWSCEESPDSVCHYYSSHGKIELIDKSLVDVPAGHNDKYETDDSCIFCGSPDERK